MKRLRLKNILKLLNQLKRKNKIMSKFSSPFLAKSPLNDEAKSPKKGRIHDTYIDNIEGDGGKVSNENAIVSDTDIKINDPKNILTRPKTKREFKKGYKYNTEDDGSITLKGRKKVSTKTKNGNHAWIGINEKENLQERYQ